MIEWYVGLNGAGKTVYLEEILDKKLSENKSIVTNIKDVKYKGFDINKIERLKSEKNFSDIFDYCDIEVVNNRILVDEDEFEYTEEFVNMITLLCRKGDILILDEPEFGLRGIEITRMLKMIKELIPFYKEGYIATHCQTFMGLDGMKDCKFYFCKDYDKYEIEKGKVHEYIGHF